MGSKVTDRAVVTVATDTGEEYGAVRKVLEEKARAGLLRLDPAILGL